MSPQGDGSCSVTPLGSPVDGCVRCKLCRLALILEFAVSNALCLVRLYSYGPLPGTEQVRFGRGGPILDGMSLTVSTINTPNQVVDRVLVQVVA